MEYLFDFATAADIENCRVLVCSRFKKEGILLNEEEIQEVTEKVMRTSYSIGGGYDYHMILSVINCYFIHLFQHESVIQAAF